MEKVFVKAPLPVKFYKDCLPNTVLLPEQIITRWGTWMEVTLFYADDYKGIKNVTSQIFDTSAVLNICKKYSISKN